MYLNLTFSDIPQLALTINSFKFIFGEEESQLGQPENIRKTLSDNNEKQRRLNKASTEGKESILNEHRRIVCLHFRFSFVGTCGDF